jgi:hypothetical protein
LEKNLIMIYDLKHGQFQKPIFKASFADATEAIT